MKCPKDANTCPKDADTKNKECCKVTYDSFMPFDCSRKKGHKGKHHTHDINKKCCATW